MGKAYNKISQVLKQQNNSGLNQIDIPYPKVVQHHGKPNDLKKWAGPWISLTDPEEMAKAVIKMNIEQYHHAHRTPFGSGPLATLLGHHENTTAAQELLQGTIPSLSNSTLPEVLQLLSLIASPFLARIPSSLIFINEEEFISVYKVTKESTSSSPFGHCVDHYKAILSDLIITSIHCTMMSLVSSLNTRLHTHKMGESCRCLASKRGR